MSLSEQEQRALREIEQSLLADDPKFGSSVDVDDDFGGGSGAVTIRGVALVVLGLCMLIGGVALAQFSLWYVTLSIAGFLVMFGAGVWMLRGDNNQSADPFAANGKARLARGQRNSGVGSKLEDNFRRRFEGN